MADTTRWTITLPSKTAEAVDILAADSGAKRAQIVNMLLGRGLSIEYLLEERGGSIIYRSPDGQEQVLLEKVDQMSIQKLKNSGLLSSYS
ncbi:hypothetical protein N836_24520 [Leptolyngbya sp. Heron Island J]|uniref:hypothetical protein n=1 Tax=Leptolyngbya sp. Heron Island J TaxID=1385935 RepID=UPI0003B99A1C|nr:hypothetical protein [Leptolyngbya sp. Heron Island J]ESA32779.1 hypothetical protein N836_24520 [Leptolyngbya sp. Heron Island J]